MAGVDVGGGGGKGRRKLDSDINMIPMIDLLMVTISFLLITAVWVHSQRMDADAQVPGPPQATPPCESEPGGCKPETRLHVDTKDETKFILSWKQGTTILRTTEIARAPRSKAGIGYPQLAAKISEEWKTSGTHTSMSDRQFDHAVVHAANDMPYADLIAVMDAVSQPKREVQIGEKRLEANALEVTFASD